MISEVLLAVSDINRGVATCLVPKHKLAVAGLVLRLLDCQGCMDSTGRFRCKSLLADASIILLRAEEAMQDNQRSLPGILRDRRWFMKRKREAE